MAFLFGILRRNLSKYFVRVLWCAVSGLVFWRAYEHYKNGPEYIYLHQILGSSLCIARGSAAVLNLNCAAVLLPMCHSSLLMLNLALRKVKPTARWLSLDTKSFHIFIAYIIFFTTVIHIAAHGVNICSFCDNFSVKFRDLNPFPYQPKSFLTLVFGTVAGITGVLMTLLLIVIFLTSLKFIRRRLFNVFWYSHRIFIPFYGMLIFHAFRGPLRMQVNVDQHFPGCNFTANMSALEATNTSLTGRNSSESSINFTQSLMNSDETFDNCSEQPEFDYIGCQSWRWLCGPLLIFTVDNLLRLVRRSATVDILGTRSISDSVVEVALQMKGPQIFPGQYILVNCPSVSSLEWHPFSIVQVPEAANNWTLKIWIKASGDWTDNVIAQLKPTCTEAHLPRCNSLKIDCPYSSCMEHLSRFKVALCVAGGVGITPFLSHILALAPRSKSSTAKLKLQQLRLVFVTRDQDLLKEVIKVISCTKDNTERGFVLEEKYFCTAKNMDDSGIRSISRETPHVSFERPSMGSILAEILAKNNKSTVGVFVCGPPGLCSDVQRTCNKFSGCSSQTAFYKESF